MIKTLFPKNVSLMKRLFWETRSLSVLFSFFLPHPPFFCRRGSYLSWQPFADCPPFFLHFPSAGGKCDLAKLMYPHHEDRATWTLSLKTQPAPVFPPPQPR